jgi:hypothetical protein
MSLALAGEASSAVATGTAGIGRLGSARDSNQSNTDQRNAQAGRNTLEQTNNSHGAPLG